MKRYVEEFGRAALKSLDGMNPIIKDNSAAKINRALSLCKRNYIAEFEAVELILAAIKGYKTEV